MAIRSNADTAFLSKTSGIINHNLPYTICFWGKLSVDRNQYTHFWAAADTTTDTYDDSDFVGTDADGTTFRGGCFLAAAGSTVLGAALTVGTWYHIAVKRTSVTDWRMYLNGVQSGATVTFDVTGRNATLGEFFNRLNGVSYFNDGVIEQYKAWSIALSDAQIATEMRSILPKRFTDLVGWTPFISSVKANSLISRLGGNWIENGTLVVEQGPPVSWGSPVILVNAMATGAVIIDLITTSLKFTAQSTQNLFALSLNSTSLLTSVQSLQLLFLLNLLSTTFNKVAQSVQLQFGLILTTAQITFISQQIQLAFLIELITTSFNFITRALDITIALFFKIRTKLWVGLGLRH